MKVKSMLVAAAMTALAGCFGSETSLIPDGEAVLPVDGPIMVCIEAEGECPVFEPYRDGYRAINPGDKSEFMVFRFAALAPLEGRQIFIIEANEAAEEYLYGLARRTLEPGPRGETVVLAAADCEDLSEEQREVFFAEGGVNQGGFITTCTPIDLDQLRRALLAAYGDHLDDEAFWEENGPN